MNADVLSSLKLDPKLDLVLDRVIDVPPALVWEAWTNREHLKHWFVPKPWSLADCEIDVRPGGKLYTLMRSPEGKDFPSTGCYLDVVAQRRLVFTDALGPGYRPNKESFMTAIVTFEPHGSGGTRYVATALHHNESARKKHEDMGFQTGWGTALDQLVAFVKKRM